MKNIKLAVFGVLAMMFTLVGCQPVNAATPLDLSLGYADNRVIEQEGVNLKVGSEYKNIRYGFATMISDKRAETYGLYAGVPIRVQGTRIEITPTVTADYYHEARETIVGGGVGLGYRINNSLVLEGVGTINRSVDSSNYTGEVYTVGLTKRF